MYWDMELFTDSHPEHTTALCGKKSLVFRGSPTGRVLSETIAGTKEIRIGDSYVSNFSGGGR